MVITQSVLFSCLHLLLCSALAHLPHGLLAKVVVCVSGCVVVCAALLLFVYAALTIAGEVPFVGDVVVTPLCHIMLCLLLPSHALVVVVVTDAAAFAGLGG